MTIRAGRHGLATKGHRPWTEAESAYLAANYERVPTMEIARHLGRRHATIREQADRLGLLSASRRIRAGIVHDYFSVVDSPVKAYVLGLLTSDGWVSTRWNEIGIALHHKDRELVELVRDELAPLTQVITRPDPDGRVGFRVSSPQMKRDLASYGVTPRKSLTLRWPATLPPQLSAPFILGVFDGDGCLSFSKLQGYYDWSLVSASEPFLTAIQLKIKNGAGVKLRGPYQISPTSRALRIEYRGPKTNLIEAWLNADIQGLARKRIG